MLVLARPGDERYLAAIEQYFKGRMSNARQLLGLSESSSQDFTLERRRLKGQSMGLGLPVLGGPLDHAAADAQGPGDHLDGHPQPTQFSHPGSQPLV